MEHLRARDRALMAARIITAIVGGYAASSATAALVARLLPVARAEATAWAMILSFAGYAAVILWSFREPRLERVLAAVWGAAALSAGAVWLLGVRP